MKKNSLVLTINYKEKILIGDDIELAFKKGRIKITADRDKYPIKRKPMEKDEEDGISGEEYPAIESGII